MRSATSAYTVQFRQPPRPATPAETAGRMPRVARLLALAHSLDARIHAGELRDMAHAAKLCGVTRARMTQIANLLLLAPAIQEEILALPLMTKGRDPISERSLRSIVAEPDWNLQLALWRKLVCLT